MYGMYRLNLNKTIPNRVRCYAEKAGESSRKHMPAGDSIPDNTQKTKKLVE